MLPILTYKNLEEVYAMLADKAKPLALYFFSEDKKVIRDLYMDKVKGLIDDNDFVNLSEAFRADRANLQDLINTAKNELQGLDRRLQQGDDRHKLIEQYTNIEHLTREMVEILIDHIVIHRRNPDTKRIPIEIYWNF